jgi:hypothetical protein
VASEGPRKLAFQICNRSFARQSDREIRASNAYGRVDCAEKLASTVTHPLDWNRSEMAKRFGHVLDLTQERRQQPIERHE